MVWPTGWGVLETSPLGSRPGERCPQVPARPGPLELHACWWPAEQLCRRPRGVAQFCLCSSSTCVQGQRVTPGLGVCDGIWREAHTSVLESGKMFRSAITCCTSTGRCIRERCELCMVTERTLGSSLCMLNGSVKLTQSHLPPRYLSCVSSAASVGTRLYSLDRWLPGQLVIVSPI